VFITTAVAVDAYLIVPDTFFHMLFPYLGTGVLMAAVAGVSVVIIVYMTGFALSFVVSIEAEVFIVIKGCRCPVIHHVTTAAVADNFLMQGIARISMTVVALI
jgi:hypothetical protein